MADEESTTPPVSELAAQLASHIANKPLTPAAGSVPTTGQSDGRRVRTGRRERVVHRAKADARLARAAAVASAAKAQETLNLAVNGAKVPAASAAKVPAETRNPVAVRKGDRQKGDLVAREATEVRAPAADVSISPSISISKS